jgi:hypothetical protein
VLVAAAALQAQALDFDFYRTRVEPIFLTKRPEHTRCIVCHSEGKRAFNLQKLAPGATQFTPEQSRRNFEMASKLVIPGKPESSVLLLHPLAHSAGGDQFHSGGRQFRSKDDPEWKTLAQWVSQPKPNR